MIKHILTKEQANRLFAPHLSGVEVEVLLRPSHELPVEERGKRVTKAIFHNGKRLGRTLALDD